MADQLDVAPTQGNLLRIQDELKQIQQGHDVLERKREVLIQRLMEALTEAEHARHAAHARLRAAHEMLLRARMQLGTRRLQEISFYPTANVTARVNTRSIMGARVPRVRVDVRPHSPPYGLDNTSAMLDRARLLWLKVVEQLGELSEKTATVWRLAMELRKTQRRVNALETIIIPQYKNTVSFIEQTLAEASREDIVRAKKIKAKQG